MLGKVCIRVGYDAEHAAEHVAEPKNGKIFDLFKFFKYSIFSISNLFFMKNVMFL